MASKDELRALRLQILRKCTACFLDEAPLESLQKLATAVAQKIEERQRRGEVRQP